MRGLPARNGRRNRPRPNRAEHLGGRILVEPDPPSFNDVSPVDVVLEVGISFTGTSDYSLLTSLVESAIEKRFGANLANFSWAPVSLKVWRLETNRPLTVRPFIPTDSGNGVVAAITDWGAPTRFSAVGYRYPDWVTRAFMNTENSWTMALVRAEYPPTTADVPNLLFRITARVQFFSISA